MKQEFESFFYSDGYEYIIKNIKQIYHPGIREETNKAVESYYDSILAYTKISLDELMAYTKDKKDVLVEFAKIRYARVGADKDAYGQEYNPDEPPGEDEQDEIVAVLPYYKDFYFTYIIEFFYMERRENKFLSFLKAMRYPNAEKYQCDCVEDFSTAINALH